MVVEGWNLYVVSSAPCFVFTIFFIVLCADKKKDRPPGSQGGNSPPPAVKAPTTGGMAGTYDPNYQTLAGVKGDVFADKRNPPPPHAPIAPAVRGMAGIVYHKRNFQQLMLTNGENRQLPIIIAVMATVQLRDFILMKL
ncbi:unnamed protein product [Angiostrongylus costaricensis]|uniref:AT-hook motif nuclear-localized protein n=1 Tax=Angiostrongylus costaricensis TaxID=334426 RepID=A0A0R3PQZ7_ANGCS|nr:unnamed protein product [Angiostrongylus costaricensis]